MFPGNPFDKRRDALDHSLVRLLWNKQTLLRCAATLCALSLVPRAGASDDVLLGRVKPPAILAISAAWQEGHDSYEPAAADLTLLSVPRPHAHLDVYFGSWCGDSRREVPRLLKILDRAAPTGLRLRFYGVDRAKKEPKRLVQRARLERVPTLVVSAGGREIGRIVETPKSTLEHDLALLLEQVPAGR